ncbi:MAG: hypothetical protein JOY77_03765 [Alphaproteobacteria bacterium]|nr:hypothetical protein [Alphaproteobacteria bacterium]MBV9062031.1 hypothetical protein [Alphaproteobacteria bacterium]
MSQPEPTSAPAATQAHVLFNGPTFHVSGVQIVPDPGEVSLYFTATRHAFAPGGSQVRSVNEVTVRLTLSPAGVAQIAEVLRAFVEQQRRNTSQA